MKKYIFILFLLPVFTAYSQPWYAKIIDPFDGKQESATILQTNNDTLLIRASTICALNTNNQCSVIGKYNITDNQISDIQHFENIQTGRKCLLTNKENLLLSSEESPTFDKITLSRISGLTLQYDTTIHLKITDNRYFNYTIKKAIEFGDYFFIGCQVLDKQTFIGYPGWQNYQESAVFFVVDENLQTDTILILPPSSGAHLKMEDMIVGPDSILYVSFFEKYLLSNVPVPYLEIRKVVYGFDKELNRVFQWTGTNLDIQESWACLAISPDSTIYINNKHDFRTYLTAMKPDGTIQWECLLDSTVGWNLYNIRRLIVADNGDIVGTGIISSVVDELGESGFLFRVTSQGHLKWKRAIRVNKGFDLTVPDIFPYETGLEDLTELSNGDLIAIGYVRKYVGNSLPDGPYNYDIWIVRTSSEGCLWQDCAYIQDIVTKDNYNTVVTSLNEWVVDWTHPFPGWPSEIRRYTFSSDSVLKDGKYYHELIYSNNMSGGPWISEDNFFREENGRTYKWLENNSERLIYDFNFGIGDSLPGTDMNQATRYVTQVGSMKLLDEIPRKYIEFNSVCGTSRWVEGIGEVEDFLYSEVFCSLWDGIPVNIRCFNTNGQLIYLRPDLSGCYTSNVKDVELTVARVYPNPGSDFLFLETANETPITSLLIYNSFGKQELSINHPLPQNSGIDVSLLQPGFYTGQVHFADQKTGIFKVVIQR
jgi:hypothetical protein